MKRRAARLLVANRRAIDVARAVLLVLEVPLRFEDAQHRAHRGVAGRIREALEHLGHRGASKAVDDFDDLPLAAAEIGMNRWAHDHPSRSRAARGGFL